MTKSRNTGRSRSSTQKFATGDLTINDFANSNKMHSKVKKAVCNMSQKVKQDICNRFNPDLNKDLSVDQDVNRSVNDITPILEPNSAVSRKHYKVVEKINPEDQQSEGQDNNYPIDIWHLIGEHISPDQVGVFAQICTKTYLVTQCAQFWLHLYKRYFVSTRMVPSSLLPKNIKDKVGLRAHVIRALHYTYFPQIKKGCSAMILNKADPHTLVNRRCTAMWRGEGGSHHLFYFKLQDCNLSKRNHILERLNLQCDTQSDNLVNDICYNNENGCKTLKVICTNGNLIPQVEGLILQSVFMTLSHGFAHHRLLLNFGTSYTPKIPTHTVVLNAVCQVEIIDWWQANYPYQEMKRECKIKLPPTFESWELI